MLNFACTAKARKRTVTLTRPSRDDPLQVEPDDHDEEGCVIKKTDKLPFQFNIVGGYEKGFGIFISKVEPGSKVNGIFYPHDYDYDVMENLEILPSSL